MGDTITLNPDSSIKKPPNKPNPNPNSYDNEYDSISGSTNGSEVVIVYDNCRAYPDYLITYSF